MICRTHLLAALAALALAVVFGGTPASAAMPAWRMLAVSGPTHLPPVSDEIQKVAVEAEGGTFTLAFGSGTTAALDFDSSAEEVEVALDALAGIDGAVEVSGGPGNALATHPYFVRFGGSLAATDVDQIVADSSLLTGVGHVVNVTTRTSGGAVGKGKIAITVTNVGGTPSNGSPIVAEFELPIGITANSTTECPVTGQKVTCSRNAVLGSGRTMGSFVIPITIESSAPGKSIVDVTVKGGGAADFTDQMPLIVSSLPASPGVQALWSGAFDENGQPSVQAGGHPEVAGAGFMLNTVSTPAGTISPPGDARDIKVDLPPGFVLNPTVTDRCAQEFVVCDAHVGWARPIVAEFGGLGSGEDPRVSNGEPAFGYAAQFSFIIFETRASVVGSLRSDEDFGATGVAPNIPTTYQVYGAVTTFEGSPAMAAGKAFLTNPTDCSALNPKVNVTGNTWQNPSLFPMVSTPVSPMVECDQLDFEPLFTFQPSTSDAASVTAATAHLHVDQKDLLDPDELAPAHLKKSVVKLPEGMVLNPSAAEGLEACTTSQIGLKGTNFPAPNPIRFTKASPSCPDASKIGTVEVQTPLLDKALKGTVYLAAQEDNPFNSLIAIYLVIDDPKTGLVIKLPGEITPDPTTGQITATFDNNPQAPFEDLTLQVRGGGPRSSLATPDLCGTYSTEGSWSPWSAQDPDNPTAEESAQTKDSFTISSGPNGAPCANTKAERPFDLAFSAGTTDPIAGKHSPFVLNLARPDGNQEIDRVSLTLPPGFTSTLKGVATCADAAVEAAKAKSGKDEIANPSCPASSQLGTTTVGAGVGSAPVYVKTGRAYLTGPYNGAPLSISFVVPAVSGPFDLGVQVVKTAIHVNPKTAQVSALSDPIPQILKGVPLQIRDIRVQIDRPNFTLNPTNCEAMAIAAKVTGASGASEELSNRFQVGDCEKLPFKPNLKIQLHGKTRRGAYQRLVATLTAKPGEANIARAAVTLPSSAFLAQEHIRTVCTRVQFAADQCPPGSIYGSATAVTPLLDEPLSGPVYLRSSDNKLPDLVAALRGPDSMPIEVELSGRTDSKNGGIRNTFDLVPDAPVSKFTLRMQGAKKSLIVNSRNLCEEVQRATVKLKAQNGKTRSFRPAVGNDCPKAGRKAPKR